MKRILSTALAIVLFVGASQAQTTEEGKGHRGKRGEMMQELDLTADQKTKLKSIREAEKAEMKALKSDGKSDADRAARKQLHDKYQTQIDAVLTAEQKAKLKEERQETRGERGKGERIGNRDGMVKDLNLTAEQKTKVADINSEFKTKMETLRSNSALSDADRRTQMKALAEEHHTRLKAVLTPEQISKMDEKRKGRNRKPNTNL